MALALFRVLATLLGLVYLPGALLMAAPWAPSAMTTSLPPLSPGRVWTNCYHVYPAGAAFGGYKMSGVGRENHEMMLDHYSQTKNLLVSYDPKRQGFF